MKKKIILKKNGIAISFLDIDAVKYLLLFLGLAFVSFQFGCKKFIEVEAPPTSINSGNVFASDATAAATLTGIYTKMSVDNMSMTGLSEINQFPGLSSDEFDLYEGTPNPEYIASYRNALTSVTNPNIWSASYSYVYNANASIQGITESNSLTPALKKQLLGEAYFVRAFCYFYLTNLYGDVPLVLTTDYNKSSILPRSSQKLV
jgi:hypothetical protein